MKNIYILPTDKPSRFYEYKGKFGTIYSPNPKITLESTWRELKRDSPKHKALNIYITSSNEEIKEGDWCICLENIFKNEIFKVDSDTPSKSSNVTLEFAKKYLTKIILTTDQDLIEDGVQAIDDDFLEWFVKNPNYESVDIENIYDKFLNGDKRSVSDFRNKYKIIIPKEKPKQEFLKQKRMSGAKTVSRILEDSKQETLEEVAKKYSENWEETTGLDYENTVPSEVNKLDFINGAKWQAERMYSEEEVKEILFHRETHYIKTAHHLHINEWFEQFKKK